MNSAAPSGMCVEDLMDIGSESERRVRTSIKYIPFIYAEILLKKGMNLSSFSLGDHRKKLRENLLHESKSKHDHPNVCHVMALN